MLGGSCPPSPRGRASYRGMGCLPLLWEGPGGAMLLICGRTLSAIAPRSGLLQGNAVFAALVGGAGRRDAFDVLGGPCPPSPRGRASYRGMRCLPLLWEGRLGAVL